MDIDDLVDRVARRAAFDARLLSPCVTAEELAAVEAALGMVLPPMLARLYLEVANGGFGPGYQILPLVGRGRTAADVYRAERGMAGHVPGPHGAHWPAGILPVLDWGCGMYAAVDCADETGTVLLFEPNGFDGDWKDAWFVDAESLAGWLETWLSGTGWYEGDVHEDGGPTRPAPWAPAAERLATADVAEPGFDPVRLR